MNFKIVTDSSSDVQSLTQVPFASAPLSIMVGDRVYVDDPELDVSAMVAHLRSHRGKTSTACPGLQDWLSAFGDAENVLCFCITSGLSGTYNAAKLAAQEYEELHPGRRVFVMDTLSTGPEMRLLIERAEGLILAGQDFDGIVEALTAYHQRTHLLFCLCSLHNLVANGRANPAIGALVGLLGIRVIGVASPKGEIEMVAKARGDKKALQAILNAMRDRHYSGGRVRIDHCNNEPSALALRDRILSHWPAADILIAPARGLCSYYAEEGGLLIGFEG